VTETERLRIRRSLSATPLGERHEDTLRGVALRIPKPLPWSAFDRGSYPEPALALAADLFKNLAVGEFSAVGLFTHLTSGLALTSAPFDLVLASSRVSSDELRHADYCVRMAGLCTGGEDEIEIERAALQSNLPSAFDLEEVDFLMLKYTAVGETLAAALLTECRRRSRDRLTRALFTSLAGDEVHHARFGWYYGAHRAKAWSLAEKQRLADRLTEFLVGIEVQFWNGRDAPASSEPAARALGVIDSATQRELIADVMAREVVPALDAFGLGAGSAWAIRKRGASSA
jgi:hypothetical protein